MNGIVLTKLVPTEIQEKCDYNPENKIPGDNPCFLVVLNEILNGKQEKTDEDLCVFEKLLGNINGIFDKSAKSNLMTIIPDNRVSKRSMTEEEEAEIIIMDYSEIDLTINFLSEISDRGWDMELENEIYKLQELYPNAGEIPPKELYDVLAVICDKEGIPIKELMTKFDMFVDQVKNGENILAENHNDEFGIIADAELEKGGISVKNVSSQPSDNVEDGGKNIESTNEPGQQKHIIQFQRKHINIKDIEDVELKNNIKADEIYMGNADVNETQIKLDGLSETQNLTNLPELEQNQFIEMLGKKILYSIKDNQTTATIKLEPEFLGKLDLEIMIDRGIMIAEFTVENQQVKALIEQNLTELKHNLEQSGVFVEEFNVSVNHHDKEDSHQGFNKRRFRNMVVDSKSEEGPGRLARIIDMYNYWEENYVDYTI